MAGKKGRDNVGEESIEHQLLDFMMRKKAEKKREKKGRSGVTSPTPSSFDLTSSGVVAEAGGNASGGILTGDIKTIESVRVSVISVDSARRDKYREVRIEPNEEGLYLRDETDESGNIVTVPYTPDTLNHELLSEDGVASSSSSLYPPHPYFQRGPYIYRLEYHHPHANDYVINLPRAYNHVKSLQILSTEIPHCMSVVGVWNNLIQVDVPSLEMSSDAPLTYFMVQLKPGNYSITGLLDAIVSLLNVEVERYSADHVSDLFGYVYDASTGEITFQTTDESEFHWRWHQKEGLSINRTIWYMLGFEASYRLNSDGSSFYSGAYSNLIDYGISDLAGSVGYAEHVYVPYRLPIVAPMRYIFLSLNNFVSVVDVDEPIVRRFDTGIGGGLTTVLPARHTGYFAKVLLHGSYGETLYNTYVSSPHVFRDGPLDTLSRLHVKWTDEDGFPVDFQGLDHSFTLEIIEQSIKLEKIGFSSQTGRYDHGPEPEALAYSRN